MPSQKSESRPTENRLLAALSKKQYRSLFSRLQMVSLPVRHQIFEQNRPVRFVYFPVTTLTCLVSTGEQGHKVVEVCTVGNEGMAGVPLFSPANPALCRAVVLLPGTALRIEAQALREMLGRGGGLLNKLVELYTQVQLSSIARSAFCNNFHKVEGRLARWLLSTHDGARCDTFPMTQDFAAYLLGLHRTAVNTGASALQGAGLIRSNHGRITILDREGLEEAACECYGLGRDVYRCLLGELLPAEG